MGKKPRFLYILPLLVIIWAVGAFAASCPYCGRQYGEGGDSAYISRIRAEHEASCSARSSSSSSYDSGYNDWQWQQEQQRQQRVWEEQERIRQEQERLRREEEARKKRLKNEAAEDRARSERLEQEWDQKKAGLRSSLKGRSSGKLRMKSATGTGTGKLELKGAEEGKLKLKPSKQEEYHRTLKTVDVPLPSDKGRRVTKQEIRREQAAEAAGKRAHAVNLVRQGVSDGVDWAIAKKRAFMDWVYLRTFDETFNRIPFVSGARSISQKGQGWYKGLRELAVGVLDSGMGKMERSAGYLGSDDVYRGLDDDEDLDDIGNTARERAGKMATSEIEGKGTF